MVEVSNVTAYEVDGMGERKFETKTELASLPGQLGESFGVQTFDMHRANTILVVTEDGVLGVKLRTVMQARGMQPFVNEVFVKAN